MRIDKKKPNNVREHKINKEIRSKFVFLIDKDGNKLGNTFFYDALDRAESYGMDLVQISINEDLPVCKIMDYGRFSFEQRKSKQKARKEQKMNEKKEIKMNPAISSNDFEVKVKKVIECLNNGYKVVVLCLFKGRQVDYPDIAMKMMDIILESTKDISKVESSPKIEGKRLTLNLNPLKVKSSV